MASLTIGCTDATAPSGAGGVASDRNGTGAASESIQCDADNAGVTLPAGFCALAVVKNVGRARHMAVRPNGDLYVAIDNGPGGVTGGILALRDTDSCQKANRQLESPGVDPCPELAVRAGIWRFSATATGQTFASGVRVATETRNMNVPAINPETGHGRRET